MKIRIPVLFLIFTGVLFFMNGCNDDEGSDCYTPPAPLVFEFVNSTGVNLIENGELQINTIKIKEILNIENTQNIGFVLREDHRILVQDVGWYNGTKNYIFESPLVNFGFDIHSSEITGNCAGFKIDSIEFIDASPTKEAYDIYRFVIE